MSALRCGVGKVGLGVGGLLGSGVWCFVVGGEVLCNVGRGTLDETLEGLEVCLFLHCSRRIWELGDKGMSSQDCHSWCEVMLWIG